MHKKQYQSLNESRVPKNSIEMFYSRLFEKYKTLKINGSTIGYKNLRKKTKLDKN